MRPFVLTSTRSPIFSPRSACFCRRWQSTQGPGSLPKQGQVDKQAATRTRFDRLISRTPRFLRPTLLGLKNAPVSHVTAFFILHEITAIVPLFGLAGAFHYWHWLPPYFAEGEWVIQGTEKFGRYFKKKGWISEQDVEKVEQETIAGDAREFENPQTSKHFEKNENTTRWIIELATAYALVKVLLPVRLIVSVWGSPWFARWTIVPVGNVVRKSLFRSPKT